MSGWKEAELTSRNQGEASTCSLVESSSSSAVSLRSSSNNCRKFGLILWIKRPDDGAVRSVLSVVAVILASSVWSSTAKFAEPVVVNLVDAVLAYAWAARDWVLLGWSDAELFCSDVSEAGTSSLVECGQRPASSL